MTKVLLESFYVISVIKCNRGICMTEIMDSGITEAESLDYTRGGHVL